MASPPQPLDEPARAQLCARLAEKGFDEKGCAQRLGLTSPRRLVQRVQAWRVVGERAQFKPVSGPEADGLDLLIALLLFGQPVARRAIESALGPAATEALLASGLVRAADDALAAQVMLFPCQGLYLATDRVDADRALNPVMPLFPESYDLGLLAVRRPIERALDVCTGSGIHALLAARHAREAVGVDISARAIAFATFNGWLNAIANVRWLEGDLYDPLPAAERYELLTANPPYNPEIASGAGEDYHSGGESGEEILARIVAGVPARLATEGAAQIITLLIHREDDALEPRIQSWLRAGGGGEGYDVLLMARDVDYRPLVLKGGRLPPADQALHESWRRQRITRFQFGLLNLQRSPAGAAPVIVGAPFGEQDGPLDLDAAAALAALASTTGPEREEASLAALRKGASS